MKFRKWSLYTTVPLWESFSVLMSTHMRRLTTPSRYLVRACSLDTQIRGAWPEKIHNNNNNNNTVLPVIIGATGIISKPFRKYVSNIPGHYEVRELQKTAILGTAHILRKVLT